MGGGGGGEMRKGECGNGEVGREIIQHHKVISGKQDTHVLYGRLHTDIYREKEMLKEETKGTEHLK